MEKIARFIVIKYEKYLIKRGKAMLSPNRYAKFQGLYPKSEMEKVNYLYRVSIVKNTMIGIVCTILLCAISLSITSSNLDINDGYINRPRTGEGDSNYSFLIKTKADEFSISVDVTERRYSEEELETIFEEEYHYQKNKTLGTNESWDKLLDMPIPDSETLYPEIHIVWEMIPDIYDIEKINFLLTLSHDEINKTYEWKGIIIGESYFIRHSRLDIERQLKELISENLTEDKIVLPANINNQEIYYELVSSSDFIYFLGMGILITVLMVANEEQKLSKRQKERESQMQLDYAGIVSKLMILMDCGMSSKRAWEKMVTDYLKKAEAGKITNKNGKKVKIEKHFAYEEMNNSYQMMRNGMSEIESYRRFSVACNLPMYIKLGTLLEQNVKRGSKQLRTVLETETIEAFSQRKNYAKKLGEEAAAKLLMPMFIMFFMVLIIIMVPAVLMFSGI
jgi:hypothetical protein